MKETSPPRMHEETVLPEWVDYNGHMNVAYYVLIFDHATDAFLETIGMNEERRETTGSSVFVAEAHVTYDQEVMEDEKVYVTSQLLDRDAKRLHVFHRMFRADGDVLCATNELMILHVSLKDRRVGPFPDDVLSKIDSTYEIHRAITKPNAASRVIGIRRKA